nr:NAD(P)-binding domain-containing protein [Ramlibacter albus]
MDLAIVGAGIGGIIHLAYARRAGLSAVALEKQPAVGGLWRQLPAWQDIQISPQDWTLGDLPLEGAMQPQILANIEAWVGRFALRDHIRLGTPVLKARHDGQAWVLETPSEVVRAHHLVCATGAHNVPVIPAVRRENAQVQELHSSALRDASSIAGKSVLVVGGGASALDLLDLCFSQGAARAVWAHRGVRWFMPTKKPKVVAGSVRGFARLQASGLSHKEQSAQITADMRSRYAKFGLDAIAPSQDFDVLHHQLFPGRYRMLENFASIERHAATVECIEGRTVLLSDGTRLQPDLLLWGTGYALDLSWFDEPRIARIRTLDELGARCGGMFRSVDAPNLYFPGVGLDGIGATAFVFSLLARTVMAHIQGKAALTMEAVDHNVNHLDLVAYLAERDPASFPPHEWRERYRAIALETPDDQPYPMP